MLHTTVTYIAIEGERPKARSWRELPLGLGSLGKFEGLIPRQVFDFEYRYRIDNGFDKDRRPAVHTISLKMVHLSINHGMSPVSPIASLYSLASCWPGRGISRMSIVVSRLHARC